MDGSHIEIVLRITTGNPKMNFKTKIEIIWYVILYPIAGIMLLILAFDVYTGKAYIKNGSTLPHQAYILVLPVLIRVTYKILKGDGWK